MERDFEYGVKGDCGSIVEADRTLFYLFVKKGASAQRRVDSAADDSNLRDIIIK